MRITGQSVAVCALVVAILCCFGALIVDRYAAINNYEHAPCNKFATYPMKDVPARCIKEFK